MPVPLSRYELTFHGPGDILRRLSFRLFLNWIMSSCLSDQYRKTTQELLPRQPSATESTSYDLYPTFPVAPDLIDCGFDKIAERIIGHKR